MIILIGILLNFLITAFCDLYICRNVLKHSTARRTYLFLNGLIYALVIFTMVRSKISDPILSEGRMLTFIWTIWIFVVIAAPKYVFVFISILGDGVQSVIRRRVMVFRTLAMLSAVTVFFVMLWGTTEGRTRIEVKKLTIENSTIPLAFDGYKIAFISDLHLETMVNRQQMLNAVVSEINQLHPDLVINGGDVVNRSYMELDSVVLSELSCIDVEDGVYSVLGNHDMGYYVKDTMALPIAKNIAQTKARLSKIGWNWLCDTTQVIRRGADSISITGITFPEVYRANGHVYSMIETSLEHAYDSVARQTYNITVSHAPQLWDNILALNAANLTLSGHVHSMQFKLGRMSPARLFYKRWSGLYQDGDRLLYINDGIGSVMFPIRIGVRPEITLIELKSTK